MPSLQTRVTPSICAHARIPDSPSVLGAGSCVAPKRTFLETTVAVSARAAQRRSAMARTPTPARVTRALPRTVRVLRGIAISFCVLSTLAISTPAQRIETAVAQIRSVLQAQPRMLSGEPGRYRFHEWIRSLAINCLCFGGHNQTRLANRARSVQEKISQSRKDGDAQVF